MMMLRRKDLRKFWRVTVKTLHAPKGGTIFKVCSIAVLFATAVYWSFLGADAQRGNADQLVDAYMFDGQTTFSGAIFPGAHTFLLKWPLFAVMQWFDFSLTSFAVMTAFMVIATLAVLVYILHVIEQRPLIFGTLCLVLASMLLLIPAQPYVGAPLPVNMAMITTRNLEYAVYILCLFAVMRRPLRSWATVFAVSGLAVLVASDKLFALLALGSGCIGYVVYRIAGNVRMTLSALRWIAVGLAAVLLAAGILGLLNTLQVTHILNQSDVSPFAITHEPRNIALGIIFGIGAVLTNFGANPAFDAVLFREMPIFIVKRLMHPTGIVFVANFVAFLGMLFAGYKILQASLVSKPRKKAPEGQGLATMLIFSTVTAGGAYVFTNHYHPVDGRYLFVGFFALAIATAVYNSTRKKIDKHRLVGLALVAAAIVPLAVLFAHTNQQHVEAAFSERDRQNRLIAQIIQESQTKVLVGDYWQVIPIKAYLPARYELTVLPLSDCVTPQNTLTSKAWQVDLHKTGFMYLAHQTKPDSTIYNKCELQAVTEAYGMPNASIVVAGTVVQPTELLLDYKGGIRKLEERQLGQASAVLPLPANKLQHTRCTAPTILNIVAHEDDDLLFMNPDTQKAISAGKCVRTVFVTSGDAGMDGQYWNSRELGAKAAYAGMAGAKDLWIQRTVVVNDRLITIATLEKRPGISLVFMRLPDGNLSGQGFKASKHTSLRQLFREDVGSLQALDSESTYSKEALVASLTSLMDLYAPTEIRSQSTRHEAIADHSDHTTVGHFVRQAYVAYGRAPQTALTMYMGYSIRDMLPNVDGPDLQAKTDAFMAYAGFDGAVCHTMDECQRTVYGPFLERQYTEDGIQ